jgi:hypothetical protein
MSRGPGSTQILVLRALLLSTLARGTVTGEDGAIWRGMSGLAADITAQAPGIDRATIRRAVRSLERSGLVDVRRGSVLVDPDTGRQLGHAQNLVRVSASGHEYLAERQPRR